MTTDQWNKVRKAFDAILERTASEQTALLDTEIDDPEVRAKVRELLRLDPVTTDWFGGEIRPAALGIQGSEIKVAEMEGRKIGPYRILQPLGRGGMGAVYLAEREDVQKQVALKLVGVSLAAGESARRFFLIEQRVLARLEHPNIARFLDAGITKDGVPFFAMEYVEGEPITDFCENNVLPQQDRLRLFADVCEAVGYAHRSLIVHRDLKPSNIFVAKDGTAKLLDFGIAELLEEEEGDGLVPGERHRLMTPAYAAPEQLQGEAPTTATDVYQLGVVLRELLTGKRTADEAPTLDGELEAIITKATAENPGNRYASAETLLEDLRRFQTQKPVLAHPDTLPYRTRKFVQRNRWGVAAVSVIAVSLIGGLGAALWQARVAGNERDQARLESEKSEEVTRFLVDLFEASDPNVAQGDTITARELMERGVEQIQTLEDRPELYTSLLAVTGEIYHNLDDLRQAEVLYRRALAVREQSELSPTQELRRIRIKYGLGRLLARRGRYAEAEPLLRQVIAQTNEENGELKQGALLQLFAALHTMNRPEAAEAAFDAWERTLETSSPTQDVATASRMVNFGMTLGYRGQIHGDLDAIRRGQFLARNALVTFRDVYGSRHPSSADALNQLVALLAAEATLLSDPSEILPEADSLSNAAVLVLRTLYPEPNLSLFEGLRYRSIILRLLGRYDEAETVAEEALQLAEAKTGKDSNQWIGSLAELARIELARQNYNRSADLFRRTWDWWKRNYGDSYLFTITNDISLASALTGARQFEEAEDRLLTSFQTLNDTRGRTDRYTRRALRHLVELYEAWNKPEEATRYRTVLEAAESRDE